MARITLTAYVGQDTQSAFLVGVILWLGMAVGLMGQKE